MLYCVIYKNGKYNYNLYVYPRCIRNLENRFSGSGNLASGYWRDKCSGPLFFVHFALAANCESAPQRRILFTYRSNYAESE